MGELARIYGLGDVAVVAGSFSESVGGHPVLEPASHGIPVVIGPHMWGQKEVDRVFEGDESGCVRCTAETLAPLLKDLFSNPEKCRATGAQALATVERNKGSARRSIDVIKKYLM